jgi:acyl-CoA-dependent ceramide synthase
MFVSTYSKQAAAAGMNLHDDDTKLVYHVQTCKNATLNGPSICVAPTDVDRHSTHYRGSQQHCRPDRQVSPRSLCAELLEHQLGFCVNAMLVVLFSYYLFPEVRGTSGGFFILSYPLDHFYGIGPQDIKMVVGLVILFTALRAASLDYLLKPLARKLGIKRTRTQTRFAEQFYMMTYYAIYWCWGLRCFAINTPEDTNGLERILVSLWTGFPQLRLSYSLKLYYISQIAFWWQQLAVLHLEQRRSDHVQMLLHHIVTIALLVGSYSYRQWRAGNAVLVCMDTVDIILPLAKLLRYVSLQRCCDAAFVVFVVAWIVTRHILFLAICWSIYKHVPGTTMLFGRYSTATGEMVSLEHNHDIFHNIFQPLLRPQSETVDFNANIRTSFLSLLLVLQCITLVWFFMILRVISRMLRGEDAMDSRSENEEDCE